MNESDRTGRVTLEDTHISGGANNPTIFVLTEEEKKVSVTLVSVDLATVQLRARVGVDFLRLVDLTGITCICWLEVPTPAPTPTGLPCT